MPVLVINIFFDLETPPNDIADKNPVILDLGGNFIHNCQTFDLANIKNFHLLYESALKEFTDIISNLSNYKFGNKHIRNFKFLDFPIYWLTDISIKHSHRHWFINLLLIRKIIKEQPLILKKYSAVTVLTKRNTPIVKLFLNDLLFNIDINFGFVFTEKMQNKYIYFKLIRGIISNSFQILKQKKDITKEKKSGFLIVFSNKQTNYTYSFFQNINKLAENCGKTFYGTPYFSFFDYSNVDNLRVAYSKLSFAELLKVAFHMLLTRSKIYLIKSHKNNTTALYRYLLKNELLSVFNNKIAFFYMYYGLIKLSKTITEKTKVFYEDEFYETGRIISKAFSTNKYTETYGIQHAVITKEHTVYNISDIEVTNSLNSDKMPIPDKFIVWGEYFKTIFLENNSLDEKFIIPAGNLSYIKSTKKIGFQSKKASKILYCLTTKNIFLKELSIIQNLSFSGNCFEISIRFHPLWKFDINFLNKKLNNAVFSISEELNIEDAILNSDIVITGAHSTAFIDALVYKKPVLRLIIKSDSIPDNLSGVYNCRNNKDFRNNLKHITENFDKKNKIQNELLNLDETIWKQLICE